MLCNLLQQYGQGELEVKLEIVALDHHHHQEHAPSWSVAVSTVRFRRLRS